MLSIVEGGTTGRQRIAVVFTDGREPVSLVPLEHLKTILSESEAVLYVARSSHPMGPLPILSAFVETAQATGGTVYSPDQFVDLDQVMARVFEDFRRRYVLYYRPSGVAREGWHEITVKIARLGSYTIRARKGYFGG